ncbi:hypothetical protein GW17_00031908 [Ensete ventricosum]|nr:hypothetical protein GW17_00031908 [Ensete ventricosum]
MRNRGRFLHRNEELESKMAPFVAPDDVDLEDGDDQGRAENPSNDNRVNDLVPLLVEPAGDDHQEVLLPAAGPRRRLAFRPVLLAELETWHVPHPVRLSPEIPPQLRPSTDAERERLRRIRRRERAANEVGAGEERVEVVPDPQCAETREEEEQQEEELGAAGEEAVAGPRDLLGRGEEEAVQRGGGEGVDNLRRHGDIRQPPSIRPHFPKPIRHVPATRSTLGCRFCKKTRGSAVACVGPVQLMDQSLEPQLTLRIKPLAERRRPSKESHSGLSADHNGSAAKTTQKLR